MEDKLTRAAKAIRHLVQKADKKFKSAEERAKWSTMIEVDAYKNGLEMALIIIEGLQE